MPVGDHLQLRSRRPPVSAVTILVAIVLLLVPALAWMQYQWLGQLSTAERERMQRTLRTAVSAAGKDDLLVQRVYRIGGHCQFSVPEQTRA